MHTVKMLKPAAFLTAPVRDFGAYYCVAGPDPAPSASAFSFPRFVRVHQCTRRPDSCDNDVAAADSMPCARFRVVGAGSLFFSI